jgi:hypothetical protein
MQEEGTMQEVGTMEEVGTILEVGTMQEVGTMLEDSLSRNFSPCVSCVVSGSPSNSPGKMICTGTSFFLFRRRRRHSLFPSKSLACVITSVIASVTAPAPFVKPSATSLARCASSLSC